MFDVGFSELVVIALVALIVIGPERLPKVARTVGHLLGRLQRYVNEVKADVSREMQLEEVKRLQAQLAEQAKTMESSMKHEIRETEAALNSAITPPAVANVAPVAETPAPVVAAANADGPVAAVAEAGTATPSVAGAVASAAPPEAAADEAGDAVRQMQLGLDLPADKPKA